MHIFDVIVNEHIGKEDRHLLHKILENQYFIIKQNQKIMDDNRAAFQAVILRIDNATTAIANKLRALIDLVKNQGLPASVESEFVLKLNEEADKLEGIGATDTLPDPIPDPIPTPDPIPVPDPTPIPEPVPEPEPTPEPIPEPVPEGPLPEGDQPQ